MMAPSSEGIEADGPIIVDSLPGERQGGRLVYGGYGLPPGVAHRDRSDVWRSCPRDDTTWCRVRSPCSSA